MLKICKHVDYMYVLLTHLSLTTHVHYKTSRCGSCYYIHHSTKVWAWINIRQMDIVQTNKLSSRQGNRIIIDTISGQVFIDCFKAWKLSSSGLYSQGGNVCCALPLRYLNTSIYCQISVVFTIYHGNMELGMGSIISGPRCPVNLLSLETLDKYMTNIISYVHTIFL